jgi:thymidine kinase
MGGSIEVIVGGMFSGKSEELTRRVRRALIAKFRVQVFKPSIDDRYSETRVVSHSGISVEAEAVPSVARMRSLIGGNTQVVAVDEAQFFDKDLLDLLNELANAGVRVIVAALDMDYLGQPFGWSPHLMAMAEKVDKLRAVCMSCGGEASFSQRIVKGSGQVQVGGVESYQARCRKCFRPSG